MHLFGGIFRLWQLLKSHRFQAIETFTHHSNLFGCPVAWLAGVPIRIASHHGIIERFPISLFRLHSWMINIGLASRLVAVSHDMVRRAVQEGVQDNRLVLIQNGVKFPQFSQEAVAALKNGLFSDSDGQIILSVGRLTYSKAHTHLLQAFARVLPQFPQARLVLAGDGPLRNELLEEANQLGIASQVKLLGVRSDVPDLMAAADIFVLPSRWEGLPLVLLEAMGSRLAIIATQVEGVREVLLDGQCGLIVPIADPQALAEAMISLLSQPALRDQLSDCAFQRFRQEYTMEKMVLRYLELLDPQDNPLEIAHVAG